jgi:tetratricopeptide (TPR) repeat protein
MGKHDIALTYIEEACVILEREYEQRFVSSHNLVGEKVKFVSIVASAFHNAAVEYEYVGDYSSCLIYYQKALKLSQMHLGPIHPLTATFQTNFEAAKQKINLLPARKHPSVLKNRPAQSKEKSIKINKASHSKLKARETKLATNSGLNSGISLAYLRPVVPKRAKSRVLIPALRQEFSHQDL